MKQFDDDLKENENEGKVNNVLATGGGDAAAILKRSSFSLEDGDWAMASAYAENALNIDPENSIGYLYKVMADKQVNKLDDLFNIKDSLTDNPDYKKAIRFADDELRDKLIECSKQIEENIRLDNNTRAYENATEKMKKAQTEESYLDAAELFAEILDFKDSEYLYQQCKENSTIPYS